MWPTGRLVGTCNAGSVVELEDELEATVMAPECLITPLPTFGQATMDKGGAHACSGSDESMSN